VGSWRKAVNANLSIPYSAQYNTINKEGHECPPPVFGAPALVWHLGISPHEVDKRVSRDLPLKEFHEESAKEYERTRREFFRDINKLLRMLQEPIAIREGCRRRWSRIACPGHGMPARLHWGIHFE
jgi:hypothetical protein